MRVLVTGGAGYLGSTLTSVLLANDHFVKVLDTVNHGGQSLLGFWSHPNFEFVLGDICQGDVLRNVLADVDTVVHLAAIVGDPACARQPDLSRKVNVSGSLELLDFCQRLGIDRFVFASTCSNYGCLTDQTQPVSETAELRPVSLYAQTKVAVELEILKSKTPHDFCPTILRFSTLYGVSPRMRFNLTVNEFAADMFTKRHLVVYGEQTWRPYLHVRDAARGILAVLQAPKQKVSGEVMNLGDNSENYRKVDLVEMLQKRIPDGTVEYVKKNEDPRNYRVDFNKIAKILNYRITRTIEDGIDEVISTIRQGVITDLGNPCYRN